MAAEKKSSPPQTLKPPQTPSPDTRLVRLTRSRNGPPRAWASRFPAGSADVVGDHAAELDRVAAAMNELPNVTAIVVSHADQRGGEDVNFAISADRAEAVVDYLAAQGIAPDRLASRAVGENDLITLENDEIAHELNRRTEFILYGVLIE